MSPSSATRTGTASGWRQRNSRPSRNSCGRGAAHLDEIQAATASAREFALVYRLGPQESGEDVSRLRQTEQALRDLGFHARLASEQDVKRLLAVYYQQDVTTEWFENCDGERWVTENA